MLSSSEKIILSQEIKCHGVYFVDHTGTLIGQGDLQRNRERIRGVIQSGEALQIFFDRGTDKIPFFLSEGMDKILVG